MKPDRLEQLLRDTDLPLPRATPDSGLADRVIQTHRRQRKVRATAAVAVALVAATSLLLMRTENRPPIAAKISNTAAQKELEGLNAQIAAQETTVQRLLAMERRLDDRAKISNLSRLPTDDALTERAASAMVYQADRMLREAGSETPAMNSYTTVISYFPQTGSANTAQKRVAELRKEG